MFKCPKNGALPDVGNFAISDLPAVTHCLDGRQVTVRYESYYQGSMFQSSSDSLLLTFSLHDALNNAFSVHSTDTVLLVLEEITVSIMKAINGDLFDSHSRNIKGMPCEIGTAVLLKCNCVTELGNHLQQLALAIHANTFEIVPVLFHAYYSMDSIESALPSFPFQQKMCNNGKYQEKRTESKLMCERLDSYSTSHEKTKADSNAKHTHKRKLSPSTVSSSTPSKMFKNSHGHLQDTIISSKSVYLAEFDTSKNSGLHEQSWATKNIESFHKSMTHKTYQCVTCFEAWSLKSTSRVPGIVSVYKV